MFYDAETLEEIDDEIETLSWHPGPCPECGEVVSGGPVYWNPEDQQVYHPACAGIVVPTPQPIVWCSCENGIGVGTCSTCGGEMFPF